MTTLSIGRHLGIGLCMLATAAAAQNDFSDVEIKAKRVTDGIYMMTGAGGNIGLSTGEDATFIIDDQFAPLTDKIVSAIRELTDKPVKFVINTHWHGDHTGGNENLGKSGAVIVAHDNVRARMSTDQFMQAFNREVKAAPPAALPVVTFSERTTLHLNGDHAHIIHVADAHTDGDAIVWFEKANVLHMGDTFFLNRYPFIDVGSGGDVDGVINAARRALDVADDSTQIIPGHGPLAGKAELQAYHDMLESLRDSVAKMKASGRSLEEVIAARPTAEYDSTLGAGSSNPDRFIGAIYQTVGQGEH